MKYFSFALLLLSTHLPLYLMDDNIQLDDKSVQKIASCIETCSHEDSFGKHWYLDLKIPACTDICTTLYKSKVKAQLQKEQTKALLTQMQTQQPKKD